MIADTSRSAYREHRASGELGTQQRKLMLFFHGRGGEHTRSELAQSTGMRLSSVCGRVNELVAMGYLEDAPRRACRVTGKSAHPVRIRVAQLNLLAAA